MVNCPCCGCSKIKRRLVDWHGISYKVCKDCGSVYQDPRVIYEYEENYWGEIIDPDGRKRDLSQEKAFKIKNWYGDTVNYVNALPPGRVLDVGAGLGFFLGALNSNWERHALDVSAYALDFIKNQCKKTVVHRGTLELSNFPEHYFDVIMFYHVIEHLDNPRRELTILKKILKKDGILIVGTPNVASLAARIFQGKFRLYGLGHLCLFNPQSLKRILSNSGFQVLKTEYPYWKTDYVSLRNILSMFMPWKISPPFYGSIMTLYTKKVPLFD